MTVAVVTGSSRGIGRSLALALAKRKIDLALLGRPSSALDETAEHARIAGARTEIIACDLRSAEAIEAAAKTALSSFGAPDAVVCCAGVAHRTPIEETSLSNWDEQLAVNLRAPFVLARSLVGPMRARRAGRFVFLGSISSTLGTARQTAYNASKWGLVGFTKSLAEELKDSGLSAVVLLPGAVDTDMLRGSGFPARMTAEEVAKTLVWLSLDAPLSHNGAVVEMFGT